MITLYNICVIIMSKIRTNLSVHCLFSGTGCWFSKWNSSNEYHSHRGTGLCLVYSKWGMSISWWFVLLRKLFQHMWQHTSC